MTRPIQVGIQLPEVERDVRWPEYASMAAAAERHRFDSIWVGDHYLYRGDGRPERGPWEAWTLLAALASVTQRVRLGPLVACLGFHAPGVTAKLAATVDEISGGRLVFGVGAGWNEPEFRAFGLPYDHRASRFAEAFEIVRALLAGERITLHGEFWTVDDALLLPRPARKPPLMIGSFGPRVLAASLPHAEIWNAWYADYGNTPEGFAELGNKVERLATRAGRPPGDLRRSACALVMLDRTSGERPLDDDVPPLEGGPDRIADGVRALAEAGADEVIFIPSPNTEGSLRELAAVLDILGA